jgi:hypothetical protein
VPLPATSSQGGMRTPRQAPVILPKVTTPQSALQPGQRSSSQPSSSAPTSTSRSFSAPHAQASSQPSLSRRTSLTSQTSQTSQQQPDRCPSASTHWTPQALSTHSAGSQPSIPHSIAPTGSEKHPAQLSPGITFAPFDQTVANGSESRAAPSTKSRKTIDVQFRLSQTSGPLDWNALLVRMIPQPSLLCHNLTTLQPHFSILNCRVPLIVAYPCLLLKFCLSQVYSRSVHTIATDLFP